MRSLSADDILSIWEIGQGQHPLDRALTLLSFALPERSGTELINLSIGQRDAYLLTLREITLGSQLDSFATCPQCGESLEFSLQVSDLRVIDPEVERVRDQAQEIAGFKIEFSLPTSQDLAAVVGYRDLPTAAYALTQRCLRSIKQGDQSVAVTQMPSAVLAQLSEYMAGCDPQAETLLDLNCPSCGHSWQILFDIVSFFWTELSVQAKRLLREVDLLARAYNWPERDILRLSPLRRQFYLELVT
jgi:predicted RNA-binding Zn-ribbon protein involved in translation (DUF1610 family)